MNIIRIWFTKTGEASYISLLDLQRAMGRVLKRSGLPVWYTMGFNPHIYMTFSCPLSLGQESLVESVDVKTEEEAPDFEQWKEKLNPIMPVGMKVTKVSFIQHKAEEIGFARYTITSGHPEAAQALDGYNAMESCLIEKKSKHALKTLELKEYLPQLDYEQTETGVRFEVLLPAGDGLNLNPALLLNVLQERFAVPVEAWNILRTAILTKNKENFC